MGAPGDDGGGYGVYVVSGNIGLDVTTLRHLNLRIAYIRQVSHAVKDTGVTATLSYKG